MGPLDGVISLLLVMQETKIKVNFEFYHRITTLYMNCVCENNIFRLDDVSEHFSG